MSPTLNQVPPIENPERHLRKGDCHVKKPEDSMKRANPKKIKYPMQHERVFNINWKWDWLSIGKLQEKAKILASRRGYFLSHVLVEFFLRELRVASSGLLMRRSFQYSFLEFNCTVFCEQDKVSTQVKSFRNPCQFEGESCLVYNLLCLADEILLFGWVAAFLIIHGSKKPFFSSAGLGGGTIRSKDYDI